MNLKKYVKGTMKAGEQVLTVTDAQTCDSETGMTIIRVWMSNSEGGAMVQNFPKSPKGFQFLSKFAIACGVTEDELENFEIATLVGKRVLGDVFKNDMGFWALQGWRPAPVEKDDEITNPSGSQDESFFGGK